MNQAELTSLSEAFIRQTLRKHLGASTRVHLFGSRARKTARWNSDYDLWIDAELPAATLTAISEELDESFVPYNVDIVTTPKLKGRFGELVRQEAQPWM